MNKCIRIALIDETITRNENFIRVLNKRASVSRKPMSKEDRNRCLELRKANVWLGKAKFCIVQSLAGLEEYIDTNPNEKPILAIRCHKCGATYMGLALGYGVDAERSEEIKQAVADGDELFLTDSVTLQACKCDDPDLENDPQNKMDKEICTSCRHFLSCICGDEFEDCKLKEKKV